MNLLTNKISATIYLGASGAISPKGSWGGVTIGAAASEERVGVWGGIGGSGGFGLGLRAVFGL